MTDVAICPWTLVRDSNESAPWQFVGLKQLKSKGGRPLVIRIVEKALWAMGRKEWGVGLADYSIDGMEEQVQIERKSISDLFSTLGQRRDNFENEISRLDKQCKWAAVIVEGTIGHVSMFKDHGPDPQSVIGTIIAWQQRYPKVHWVFPPSRSMAEALAFRYLDMFWRNNSDVNNGKAETIKC